MEAKSYHGIKGNKKRMKENLMKKTWDNNLFSNTNQEHNDIMDLSRDVGNWQYKLKPNVNFVI